MRFLKILKLLYNKIKESAEKKEPVWALFFYKNVCKSCYFVQMFLKRFSSNLLTIISAVLTFIAIAEINFTIGWICFVPLFIAVSNASSKQYFKQGFIFGFTFSCFTYSWMISGAERFTGYNFLYGAGVFLICALVISLYWACLLLCVSFIFYQLQ